jgi:hypothetical protein
MHPERFRRRTAHRLTVVVALAATGLVVSAGLTTVIPGGGAPRSDCYVVLNVQGTRPLSNPKTLECTDGDPSCDTDGTCNDACILTVQLCINQPGMDNCTPPPALQKVKVKSHPATLTLNAPGSRTGPECGAFVDVNLPIKGQQEGPETSRRGQGASVREGGECDEAPERQRHLRLEVPPSCRPLPPHDDDSANDHDPHLVNPHFDDEPHDLDAANDGHEQHEHDPDQHDVIDQHDDQQYIEHHVDYSRRPVRHGGGLPTDGERVHRRDVHWLPEDVWRHLSRSDACGLEPNPGRLSEDRV